MQIDFESPFAFDIVWNKAYNHIYQKPSKVGMQNKRLSSIKNITLLALMLALTIIFCFVPVQFGTITLALMILPTIILSQVASFKTSLAMGIMMGIVNYIAWFTTKAASPVAPIFQNPIVCILPRILIAIVCYFTRYGLQKVVFFARIKRICDYEYVRECAYENTQNNDIHMTANNPNVSDFCEDNHRTCNISKACDRKARSKQILTDQFIYALSAALGVVTNTLFVAIFTLIFFNGTSIAQNTIVTVKYVLAWFGVNFAVEVVSFSLLTPPIVLALKAAKLA